MTCLSNTQNIIEFHDLPDELILTIMNKIKLRPILLYSMIGIKNIRLEQLALGQCHSIDLTSDYFDRPFDMLIEQFMLFTLPYIFNYIKSLTISITRIRDFNRIALTVDGENDLSNLKHLKIMAAHLHYNNEMLFRRILDCFGITELQWHPLFSDIPQLFYISVGLMDLLKSFYRYSPIMSSIISFEFGPDYVVSISPSDKQLFFTQSHNLTHIRITFRQFHDCVCLFNGHGICIPLH